MKVRWVRIPCWSCGGHGIKGVWLGDYEIVDCRDCGGSGAMWCSSKDRLADYPGGPLRGSAPGEYAAATARAKEKDPNGPQSSTAQSGEDDAPGPERTNPVSPARGDERSGT